MREITISLNSVSQIISLARVLSGLHEDVDLKCGHFIVDAKSVMGVLSLDFKKPVTLIVHSDNDSIIDFVMQELKEIGAIA